MATMVYIKERFLQALIKTAWDLDDRGVRIRLLRALELPESLVSADLEAERRVNFPDSAPFLFRGRWGRVDLRFSRDGIVLAWVELKLTASPDSLKLAAYAAGHPNVDGRLVSPYRPGWQVYPQAEGPPVKHILLPEVVAAVGAVEGVTDVLGLCERMSRPALLPSSTTIADLLFSDEMPEYWRWADAASGGVLGAEMERVELRSLIRVLGTDVEADLVGSPVRRLHDRPYFCAWQPWGDGHGWDAAEIQFFREREYRGRLSTVHLFVTSYSDADPTVVASPDWLTAGAVLARSNGWGSSAQTDVSPTVANGTTGNGYVFEAAVKTMTVIDLGRTMEAAVRLLSSIPVRATSSGTRVV